MRTPYLSVISLLLILSSKLLGGNADFEYNNHCINNLIYFEDLTTADEEVVSWYWEFGDGGVAMDKSPVHAFSESGEYDVKLTVKTKSGEELTTLKKIDIKAAPFAFFNPKSKCDQNVNFTDNSFTKATKVKMWMWDFGDGDYSLEQNPNHRFDIAEKSKVHLKVLDKNGCGDSITQSVNVIENPVVGFDINNVILSNPAIIKINSHNNKDSVFYLINNQLASGKGNLLTIPSNTTNEIKQKAINEKGCIDSASLTIAPNHDFHIPLPTVFSPNQGNNTSTFGVSNPDILVKDFRVFNSNGIQVYQATNNSPWNGNKQNGAKCENGIYVYSLEYENDQKVKIIQKGKVILQF